MAEYDVGVTLQVVIEADIKEEAEETYFGEWSYDNSRGG